MHDDLITPAVPEERLERPEVILLDTHVWVRWVNPQANPLSPGILDCIETAEQLAVSAVT
ncbi:MAG: hypothetical protein U1F70_08145 [Candidatus Competibacteraceae bacterium]